MKKMRIIILIAVVLIAGGFIFWKDVSSIVVPEKKSEQVKKEKDEGPKEEVPAEVQVANKWNLPDILKEVSGITYLDNQRFACVQDELGVIFIYNRSSNKIEKKINFAGPGDFEGLTTAGNTAYVVRADGVLFEVDLATEKLKSTYKTHLTVEQNVEGLGYDEKNNRLLLTIKDDEPGNKDYKGIYAFDLFSKKLAREPALKIDIDHELLVSKDGKKSKTIRPSALGIHPQTRDLYIIDGPRSKLMIMTASGDIKNVLQLGKDFIQPEGISFSPDGKIFISNEGSKEAGNIIEIEIM